MGEETQIDLEKVAMNKAITAYYLGSIFSLFPGLIGVSAIMFLGPDFNKFQLLSMGLLSAMSFVVFLYSAYKFSNLMKELVSRQK